MARLKQKQFNSLHYVFNILIRGKFEIADISNVLFASSIAIGATVAKCTPG
jgi:hypothetical protein